MVRTDHYSLKFMLDQRLSTVPQHHWISKLFGYDFSVEYRPGRLNTVADALSRRDATDGSLAALSAPSFALYDDIRSEVAANPDMLHVHNQILAGELQAPWHLDHGLILHGSRVYLAPSSNKLQTILKLAHEHNQEGN